MTNKELINALINACDGETVKLVGDRIDVFADDCLNVYGYHLSNTCLYSENPTGERPTLLFAKDKKGLTVDGNGATVYIHGIMTPFLFDGCENLTLKNIVFDYEHPTMSEFTVRKNDGEGNCEIEILKDCLFDITENGILWHGEQGKNGKYLWEYGYRGEDCIAMFKDPVTEYTQMFPREEGMKFPCVPEFEEITRISGNTLKVKLKNKDAYFPIGVTVQTRDTARLQIGGAFVNCKNVVVENVTVHAINGFGLLTQFCDDVTYRGVTIVPSKGRTIASNADFLHASGCRGKFLVEDCVLKEGHDDFINVHGTHLKVVGVDGKTLTLQFPNPNTRGFKPFLIGDQIELADKNTLINYASDEIVGMETISDDIVSVSLKNGVDAVLGDCVENVSATPEITIRNNKFGPSMGRGVLCTSRKKTVIENNVFYKLGGAVLGVFDDCNFWYESGRVTDVSFTKNTVVDCGYGYTMNCPSPVIIVAPQVIDKSSDKAVHGKVEIKSNVFRDVPQGSLLADVKFTDEFILADNEYDEIPSVYAFKVNKLTINESDVKITEDR